MLAQQISLICRRSKKKAAYVLAAVQIMTDLMGGQQNTQTNQLHSWVTTQ